jgi:hypothetical protein
MRHGSRCAHCGQYLTADTYQQLQALIRAHSCPGSRGR